MSFFLALLNDGIFWDDWSIYNHSLQTKLIMSREIGNFLNWIVYIQDIILTNNAGVFLQRAIIFFCYLISSFCVFYLLSNTKNISQINALIIALIFAIIPLNTVKFLLTVSYYAFCYFFFFIGLFFTGQFLKRKKIIFRLLSLFFFFFSFSVGSFLVFYSIAIIYIWYSQKDNFDFKIKNFFFFILKYLDFFLLPVIFWSIKIIFYSPYGVYQNYNAISLENALNLILKLPLLIHNAFIRPLFDSLKIVSSSFVFFTLFVCILISAFLFFKKKLFVKKENHLNHKQIFIYFIFGIFILLVGAFPYLVVNKMPLYHSLKSRHQLLLPLGAAFIFFSVLRLVSYYVKRKYFILILSTFLSLFIITNFKYQVDLHKDHFKQLSLIRHFKENEIIKNNSLFFFNDKTLKTNFLNRSYRVYDWTGLLRASFNNSKRLGINLRYAKTVSNVFIHRKQKQYNFYEFDKNAIYKNQYIITINYGSYQLTTINTLNLLANHIFSSKLFDQKIENIITLNVNKFIK